MIHLGTYLTESAMLEYQMTYTEHNLSLATDKRGTHFLYPPGMIILGLATSEIKVLCVDSI